MTAAEEFLGGSKRFEVDGEGNVVGGVEREQQLAETLARETIVVVRVTNPEAEEWLAKLGGAAEGLLGESRTVEEKEQVFGAMQAYDGGVVAGYAGGESYGNDQFLETRGSGGGGIVPAVDEALLPDVNAGRVSESQYSELPGSLWYLRKARCALHLLLKHAGSGLSPRLFVVFVSQGSSRARGAPD